MNAAINCNGLRRFAALLLVLLGTSCTLRDAKPQLHIFAITSDGKAWHTVLHPHSRELWEEITTPTAAGKPGDFVSADCTDVSGILHFCGVTANEKLWHTFLGP